MSEMSKRFSFLACENVITNNIEKRKHIDNDVTALCLQTEVLFSENYIIS